VGSDVVEDPPVALGLDRKAGTVADVNAPPLSVTSLIRLILPATGSVSYSARDRASRRSASAMASSALHVVARCQPNSYFE
jgi:hypothetical protein